MEERNELNDIILNRGSDSSGSSKKIILAVAILTIVLIVAVLIMKSSSSNTGSNLPQTPQANKSVLPPEPPTPQSANQQDNNSLFEPVEVVKDGNKTDDDLDKIASKLKQESLTQEKDTAPKEMTKETATAPEPAPVPEPKTETETMPEPVKTKTVQKEKVAAPKKVVHTAAPSVKKGQVYIQVGAFSHYAPDKKFLASIRNLGYMYTYHKVKRGEKSVTKVLVGPFENESDAKAALKNIREKVVSGAFVTKK